MKSSVCLPQTILTCECLVVFKGVLIRRPQNLTVFAVANTDGSQIRTLPQDRAQSF